MFTKFFYIFFICIANAVNAVVTAQNFYWRDYSHGLVPFDAVEGKSGIYVGQAYYNNHGNIPVAIYPHRNAAVMIYGTRQNIKENIKILCSPEKYRFYWELVDFTQNYTGQMTNVIRGGFQDAENLYVGAVQHEGDWKIGKVKDFDKPDQRGLYVWDKTGNHVKIVNFELLKYNSTALPVFDIDVRNS